MKTLVASQSKLWTPKDLADYLRVDESVVRYWVRIYEVPHIRLGRQIRFDPEDILEWIAAKSNHPRFVDLDELGT